MALLSLLFFVVGIIAAYWFWLRPLFRSRPLFSTFYARADSFWAAVGMKINSLKTKLAAALAMIASVLLGLHDFIIPLTTGIDWTPVTSLVPAWVWPFVSFGFAALIWWFRSLTAQTQDIQIAAVAAGATPAEAVVVAEQAETPEQATAIVEQGAR